MVRYTGCPRNNMTGGAAFGIGSARFSISLRTRRAFAGRMLLCAASGYFAIGISVAIAQPSSPLANELQNLFAPAMEREETRASTDPTIVRARAVRVNFDLFAPLVPRRGDKLRLNLFDDTSFVAIFERSRVRSPGSYTWFGRLAGEEYSSFILVVERGVAAASP